MCSLGCCCCSPRPYQLGRIRDDERRECDSRGVTEFLDVPGFHGGSSDTPVWAADGRLIFHTAKDAK